MIEFIIPGPAVGKGRPKFARRGAFVTTYTPEKTASYESLVKLCAAEAMRGKEPTASACRVEIRIQIMPPKSWSQKRTNEALGGNIQPIGKPDLDNVAKAILDACNGIVWRDDAQVVSLLVEKAYAHKSAVLVRVET